MTLRGPRPAGGLAVSARQSDRLRPLVHPRPGVRHEAFWSGSEWFQSSGSGSGRGAGLLEGRPCCLDNLIGSGAAEVGPEQASRSQPAAERGRLPVIVRPLPAIR